VSTLLVDLGAAPAAGAVGIVLAQDPAPPPGEGPEFGKASPTALVVIILLGIATVFLIRSMTKHLRRVPESFDDPAPVETGTGRAESAGEPAAESAPAKEPQHTPPADRAEPDPPGDKGA
jgi:hypothetical protein